MGPRKYRIFLASFSIFNDLIIFLYCVVCWICSVVSALVALVLYPVSFARELPHGNRSVWEFGWVT